MPWDDGRVALGATVEDVGFDARATAAGLRQLFSEGLRVSPGLAEATFREVRVGLRPVSDDDLPVLGPLPDVGNVHVATGHGANGLLLGPVSGRIVADLVADRRPALDVAAFAPAAPRFGLTATRRRRRRAGRTARSPLPGPAR